MSEGNRRLVERILDPAYLDTLAERPIDELRAMRDECREAETEVSFERRLCQARIEILRAELDRRSKGAAGEDLVARLPDILAPEPTRGDAPLPDRAPDFSVPRSADVPRRRVDEIVGEQTIARLPKLSVDEIKSVTGSLTEYEKGVSARRKRVQQVMDSIQEEIVRRYTAGEADPTAALG